MSRKRKGTVNRTPCRGLRECLIISLLLAVTICARPAAAQTDGEALLAQSIALYPTLASYSDTGTVVREAPGIVDQWQFRTFFRRASLDLFFDFQGVTSRSGELVTDSSAQRVVFWMRNGELQSYNQAARAQEIVPRDSGNQPAALQRAAAYTAGTSILVPSLIFSRANLPGTILQVNLASHAGIESVDGHRCHKITGTAYEQYQTGRLTNVRAVTVWIDEETLLVRKVFEDTPEGYPAGSYFRLTVTIDPELNPALDDNKFEFAVPASQP